MVKTAPLAIGTPGEVRDEAVMVHLGHGAVLAGDGFASVVVFEHDRADVAGLDPFAAAALAREGTTFGLLQRAQCGAAGSLNQPGIAGYQRLDAYRLRWRKGQVKTRPLGRGRPRRASSQDSAGVGIDAAKEEVETAQP
jgi:hypothetical protein